MLQPRRLYASLLGVVALSTTTTDTVFSILDAVSLSAGRISFIALPIASVVFNVVALGDVTVFSVQYVWKRDGIVTSARSRRILALSCILLSIIALVVSLVSLVIIRTKSDEVTRATSRAILSNWNGQLTAQLTIWTLSFVSQTALFSVPLWKEQGTEPVRSGSLSGTRYSAMSEIRHSNQTTHLHMLESTPPASPLAALPSPTFSSRSSQSIRSWRESLHQVVRPVTSRTRLISRSSLNRDARSVYSEHQSTDNVSQSDGFDTWDTSSVDPQSRDAVLSAPSRGTALSPIPGSRPASPARALDGPFPLESDGRESPGLVMPPKMLPDTSRPPSPAVSEAHIHPLFRTESSTPPPTATPGTIIVASPLSNHMIACPARPYSRMRSNSHAASPSHLVHSQSMQSLHERAIKTSESARSPPRPSLEMTPPIPDFVLTSSPRSSMGGVQARPKIKLRRHSGK